MILVKLLNILKRLIRPVASIALGTVTHKMSTKVFLQLKTDKHHSPLWNFF